MRKKGFSSAWDFLVENGLTNYGESEKMFSKNDFVKKLNKIDDKFILEKINYLDINKSDFLKENSNGKNLQNILEKKWKLKDDDKDMIDDIIHEIAHLAEENLGHYIYSDRKIIDEFLGKRERLYSILKAQDLKTPNQNAFYDLEYNKKFDHYHHKIVGYEKLTYLTMGLFVSPYSITSLREYFAKSFERYFMDEMEQVRKVSPAVFEKIEFLVYKKYE